MRNDHRMLAINNGYTIAQFPSRKQFGLYKVVGNQYLTVAVFKSKVAAHDFMDYLLVIGVDEQGAPY